MARLALVAALVAVDQLIKSASPDAPINRCLMGGRLCLESDLAVIAAGWLMAALYVAIALALSTVFRNRKDVFLPLLLMGGSCATLTIDMLARGYAVDYLTIPLAGGGYLAFHIMDVAFWAACGIVVYRAIDAMIYHGNHTIFRLRNEGRGMAEIQLVVRMTAEDRNFLLRVINEVSIKGEESMRQVLLLGDKLRTAQPDPVMIDHEQVKLAELAR